jgi:hypothetical protein
MQEQTAKRAAKWWADFLRNGAPLDNGDASAAGAMAVALWLITQQQYNNDDADKFEAALADRLSNANEWEVDGFGCDYHPDMLLRDAIETAGISVGMADLPWKTTMWIRGDTIKVSCGYGSPIEELR